MNSLPPGQNGKVNTPAHRFQQGKSIIARMPWNSSTGLLKTGMYIFSLETFTKQLPLYYSFNPYS